MHLSPTSSVKFNVQAKPKTALSVGGDSPHNTFHSYRSRNRQNAMTGAILAEVEGKNIGKYNETLLDQVIDCCTKQKKLLTPSQYKYIYRSICKSDRPKWQHDAEEALKIAGQKVCCAPSSDVLRDSAASIVLADYCAKLDNDNFKKFDIREVVGDLLCQLACCGVKCQPVNKADAIIKKNKIGHTEMLNGIEDLKSRKSDNKTNLDLALAALGRSEQDLNPQEKAYVGSLLSSANSSGGTLSVGHFKAELKSKGLKENSVQKELFAVVFHSAGMKTPDQMSGVWPVDVPWAPAFPYGVDRGTGLDMRTTDDLHFVMHGLGETSKYGSAASDVGADVVGKLLSAGVDLGKKFGEAKIKEMEKEAELAIEKKMIEAGIKNPTPKQVSGFKKDNPDLEKDIALDLLKKNGLNQADLDDVKEKLNAPDWKKIALYSGIAVGGLAAIGTLIYALRRK